MHRHVFLVGVEDYVLLREQLATQYVQVELHDSDEYVAEEDEKEARFSYGVAKFSFNDFLKPATLEIKLRSDVFPLKRE